MLPPVPQQGLQWRAPQQVCPPRVGPMWSKGSVVGVSPKKDATFDIVLRCNVYIYILYMSNIYIFIYIYMVIFVKSIKVHSALNIQCGIDLEGFRSTLYLDKPYSVRCLRPCTRRPSKVWRPHGNGSYHLDLNMSQYDLQMGMLT